MFPAPPLPAENLEDEDGMLEPKRDAGPRAELGEVVAGALKVFPAPPRPEWMYLPADGCGSVIK